MRGVVERLLVSSPGTKSSRVRGEYDFAAIDRLVEAGGEERDRCVAVRLGDRRRGYRAIRPSRRCGVPRTRAAWGGFIRSAGEALRPGGLALAGKESPVRPIRRWQVWNEPNFRFFWAPRPLRAGLRRFYASPPARSGPMTPGADPAGRAAPIEGTSPPWVYLRELLEIPGLGRYFDRSPCIRTRAGSTRWPSRSSRRDR